VRTARRHLGRGEIHGYADYEWRSEQFETDLRLFTFSRSLARLQRAIPDIEAFVPGSCSSSRRRQAIPSLIA
jgi:hypothetical protein